jgi:hypothetical protein
VVVNLGPFQNNNQYSFFSSRHKAIGMIEILFHGWGASRIVNPEDPETKFELIDKMEYDLLIS